MGLRGTAVLIHTSVSGRLQKAADEKARIHWRTQLAADLLFGLMCPQFSHFRSFPQLSLYASTGKALGPQRRPQQKYSPPLIYTTADYTIKYILLRIYIL